jgi:hypothetical protein
VRQCPSDRSWVVQRNRLNAVTKRKIHAPAGTGISLIQLCICITGEHLRNKWKKWMEQAEQAAQMGRTGNTYKISVRMSESKRPAWRTRHTYRDNIKAVEQSYRDVARVRIGTSGGLLRTRRWLFGCGYFQWGLCSMELVILTISKCSYFAY